MGCCYTDVFISYKAEDRAQLKPLVDALEAEGFAVWWDAHIGGGTNWHEDIEEHLNPAKCVIVAWSKRSISHDGHFVRDEARRAQRRGTYLAVDDRSTAGVDFLDDLVADRSLVGVGAALQSSKVGATLFHAILDLEADGAFVAAHFSAFRRRQQGCR